MVKLLVNTLLLFLISFTFFFSAQSQAPVWTFEECLNYALEKNIQVQTAALQTNRNKINYERATAAQLPSANASIGQNLAWSKKFDSQNMSYGSLTGTNSTSASFSSSIMLFNGFQIRNQINQSEINLESSKFYLESVKESVELNVLSAYLQILYAYESVSNAKKQIVVTQEQLILAKERLELGLISQSDYLQIKSELASESLTLTDAESQLILNKISLMQLMEYPVNDSFEIVYPDIEQLLNQELRPVANSIYNQSLSIRPEIKQAELNTQSALLDVDIANAAYYPSLSMSAGIGTSFSDGSDYTNMEQLQNKLNPHVGLSLSIPIFQKKQAKSSVELAKIGITSAELTEINTKNELRKSVEQATANVIVAQKRYLSNQESLRVQKESMDIATEKFSLGLVNSVDYLFERTSFIASESQLLQSKYKLLYSYKILDFYKGEAITL
ncbi:MAG: TolC family protein [Bacteroidales bacterium]|nr:TolC family protein [Bacteroidales bacterium]MBN2820431.1 TolC family protein [Bacteroidales bacterium]